jgi:hypothetical protein
MNSLPETVETLESLEVRQAAEELRARIARLSLTDDGESLAEEMNLLKAALHKTPAACLLLLPEDMGQMIATLRRITGVARASAANKKESKSPKIPKILSKDALLQSLSNTSADDEM